MEVAVQMKRDCLQMKALTLWQPWATLIALKAKQYETRRWTSNHRGPLAIHAAKNKRAYHIYHTEPFHTILKDAGYPGPEWLPYGKIVAICRLGATIQITATNTTGLSQQELAFGDFTPGRYAWSLQNIQRLEIPIPIQGKQGLWTWDYSKETPAVQRVINALVLHLSCSQVQGPCPSAKDEG